MAAPLLYQELTPTGNGVDQNTHYDVPPVLLAQYDEFTIYVQFGAGVGAGKLQVQTSFLWPIPSSGYPYGGGFESPLASLVWANVGSTIDWAAASSQKYASVTGVFSALRVNVDTAVTGGPIRVGIVCASKN